MGHFLDISQILNIGPIALPYRMWNPAMRSRTPLGVGFSEK